MTLHLVTDRRRLCPGGDHLRACACLVDQARYAVSAGLDVIQIRERDLEARPLLELARAIVGVARGSGTRVVVNDRLDVALAAAAHGVHLRADSIEAARVRACAPPGFLVGRSVHSAAEARGAGPVDYVIAGTVWSTPSKPDGHPLLGLEGLASVARATTVPVLAIGGIDAARAGLVAAAGAAGIAGIGAWIGEGARCHAVPLEATTQAYRDAFQAGNMGGHSPD